MPDDLITFDARRLFAGINYHLRQRRQPIWAAVHQITPDSVLYLWRRLRKERRTASVSRFTWRHWDDRQRYAWLMINTGTQLKAIVGTLDEDGKATYELMKTAKKAEDSRGHGIIKESEDQ